MKTCGMMGEVVDKAASVAVKHGTTLRGVYADHWSELDELLKLPGQTRRATRTDVLQVAPDGLQPVAVPQ